MKSPRVAANSSHVEPGEQEPFRSQSGRSTQIVTRFLLACALAPAKEIVIRRKDVAPRLYHTRIQIRGNNALLLTAVREDRSVRIDDDAAPAVLVFGIVSGAIHTDDKRLVLNRAGTE